MNAAIQISFSRRDVTVSLVKSRREKQFNNTFIPDSPFSPMALTNYFHANDF